MCKTSTSLIKRLSLQIGSSDAYVVWPNTLVEVESQETGELYSSMVPTPPLTMANAARNYNTRIGSYKSWYTESFTRPTSKVTFNVWNNLNVFHEVADVFHNVTKGRCCLQIMNRTFLYISVDSNFSNVDFLYWFLWIVYI